MRVTLWTRNLCLGEVSKAEIPFLRKCNAAIPSSDFSCTQTASTNPMCKKKEKKTFRSPDRIMLSECQFHCLVFFCVLFFILFFSDPCALSKSDQTPIIPYFSSYRHRLFHTNSFSFSFIFAIVKHVRVSWWWQRHRWGTGSYGNDAWCFFVCFFLRFLCSQ